MMVMTCPLQISCRGVLGIKFLYSKKNSFSSKFEVKWIWDFKLFFFAKLPKILHNSRLNANYPHLDTIACLRSIAFHLHTISLPKNSRYAFSLPKKILARGIISKPILENSNAPKFQNFLIFQACSSPSTTTILASSTWLARATAT